MSKCRCDSCSPPITKFKTITSVERRSIFNYDINIVGTTKKGKSKSIIVSCGRSDSSVAQAIYFIKKTKMYRKGQVRK